VILPFVREIFADVEKSLSFQRAATLLKSRAGRIRLSGLISPAKAAHLPLFHRAADRPLLFIVASNRVADDFLPIVQSFCELSAAADPESVVKLPAYDVLPFENLSPHPEIQEERASALWKIATGEAQIVIAPIEATAMRLQPASFYSELARTLRRGESVEPDALLQHLNIVGYTAADIVEMPGQYALRGGILDVYPPESDRPLRIEFFGDEVESIRKFDPTTQRSSSLSSAPLDEAVLLPLSEVPVSGEVLAAIHARLSGRRIAHAGSDQDFAETVASTGITTFPGWEFYAPVFTASSQSSTTSAAETGTLFDLLPNCLVLLDEPSEISRAAEHWWEKVVAMHERSGVGSLVTPADIFLHPDQLQELIRSRPGASLEELGLSAETEADQEIPFTSQPTSRFHGSVPGMVEEVKKLRSEGRHVIFAAPNLGEVERLADIFSEYTVPYRLGSRVGKQSGENFMDESAYATGDLTATTIVKAVVPYGFVLPDAAFVIFGAQDLFDDSEVVVKQPLRQKSKVSAFLSDFRDLAVGDYVVHVEHGIAQYQGLREIAQSDSSLPTEFMVLEFAEAAKLYVPLTRLDLIQKYRSTEGARPQLSRLGSNAWEKTKSRVKKAMKDMADELVKLYAVRETIQGHAFPPDNQFQHEFEDSFEHNETDDQVSATADIKRDMELPTPMDRLLCGDVGYGKTEVAMRAAFKAVNDGKQVAVLAPTTVLTFQHFETFKQRFAAFPINIEMLSRFRNPKQQKEIVEKVEQGKIDILIGTHRLLSKDIKFPNLGLLVVDEEQRFGVRHKERLKQMKKEVDVLTMSATPIPRTLHMSLVGLRDMSVIETPPRDRMAIQTVVAAYDEKLVKSAIEHELERGGQIYFVHNRVESIYEIAAKIQELVPQARVIVGHGQMSEGHLEKAMMAFVRHEADVLVSTTIIENGLDIPLCNTILINRADRHGLSELYQLRGRVGRSNRRAYAYLLIPAERELTPIARRRLAALKEFSDLGAGFKIAALDLELRGAGNLLGGEQSGHIESVGFEMYTTMLERTVRELKGEAEAQALSTQLNLALNLRIPNEYVQEENQRLRMYKRIAGVESEEQLQDVRSEMEDRYGPLPAPVRNLLDATALKLFAQRVGVAAIERKQNVIHLRFTESANVDPSKLAEFVAGNKGAQFSPGGTLKFVVRSTNAEDVLAKIKDLLQQLVAEPVRVA
jgi:transcription-repair coupling factor (superfamily II helicase)